MSVSEIYDQVAGNYDESYIEKRFVAEDRLLRSELLKACGTNGSKIVDFGCGTGLAYDLLDGPSGYIGIDLSKGMLERAKEKFPEGQWHQGDVLDSGLIDNSADVIISLYGCVTYVKDIKSFFCEIKRILKPTGKFFLVGCNVSRSRVRNSLMVNHSRDLWCDHTEKDLQRAMDMAYLNGNVRLLSHVLDSLPTWLPQSVFDWAIRAEWFCNINRGVYMVIEGHGKA